MIVAILRRSIEESPQSRLEWGGIRSLAELKTEVDQQTPTTAGTFLARAVSKMRGGRGDRAHERESVP